MKKDCSFTTGACSGQGWEQKEKKKTAKWGFVPILCVAGEALLSLCPERGDFSWNLYSVHICCSLAALVSKPENIGAAGDPRTFTAIFVFLQILISVSALLIMICFCFDIYSVFSIGVFSGKDGARVPLHQD